MARQRTLTIPQSLSLAKMWFKLLTVNGGMIKWTFWTMNEIQFWQICGEAGIQNLMDFPIPYARNTTSLKVMLNVWCRICPRVISREIWTPGSLTQ